MLDNKKHFPGRKTRLSLVFISLILGMATSFSIPLEVLGQAASSKTATPKTALPATTAIPIPEILTRAAELTDLLRDMNGRLASSKQIDSIGKLLPDGPNLTGTELTPPPTW